MRCIDAISGRLTMTMQLFVTLMKVAVRSEYRVCDDKGPLVIGNLAARLGHIKIMRSAKPDALSSSIF